MASTFRERLFSAVTFMDHQVNLKSNSKAISDGPNRAPARAMLKASGFTDDDLRRPFIGVANTWIEIGPCNYHLRELAASLKQGIRAAGGTPMVIPSEIETDSIELVARGNHFDAIVAIVGCD